MTTLDGFYISGRSYQERVYFCGEGLDFLGHVMSFGNWE